MKIQFKKISAGVAELADAPDLGSGGFTVGVQVPSPAPMPEGRLTEASVTDPFHYGKKVQIAVRRGLPLFGRDSRLQNRPPEGFAAETSPAPMPEGRLTELSVTDPFHYGKISANRFDRHKIAVLVVAISANNRNFLRLFAEIIAYCIVNRDYLCYNELQYIY